ncbi:MAG TPA: hypothetical protein VM820_05175 [Vicinamibacterales bacterium]|nr:hypothetical protein [Vicinamibacterales bacterium]
MAEQVSRRVGALLVAASAVWALAPVAGQAPAGVARPWTTPRTADGQPDLQGNWTNATITPIDRPQGAPPVYTEQQVRRMEKGYADRVERLAQPSDPNRTAPPQGGDGSTGAAGNVGGYNNFWIDPGDRVAVVNGEYRSSLIVDPPNGRPPELSDTGKARAAARAEWLRTRGGEYDHPEFRPLAERCLMSFGSNAGPPMLPNYFYNNNYQIVQTKDQILILVEMVHDVRVIRLNATTHPPAHVRTWMGDSIGRWEGETLVVETTNFHPLQAFRGASGALKVLERFRRVDADTILYTFTIDDPATWTAQWSGEVPFRRSEEPIYEYACHEGNYALSNILSGARAQERETETKKPQ